MKLPAVTTVRKVLASSVSIGTPLDIHYIDIKRQYYRIVKVGRRSIRYGLRWPASASDRSARPRTDWPVRARRSRSTHRADLACRRACLALPKFTGVCGLSAVLVRRIRWKALI